MGQTPGTKKGAGSQISHTATTGAQAHVHPDPTVTDPIKHLLAFALTAATLLIGGTANAHQDANT